jgi:hypothetical protein
LLCSGSSSSLRGSETIPYLLCPGTSSSLRGSETIPYLLCPDEEWIECTESEIISSPFTEKDPPFESDKISSLNYSDYATNESEPCTDSTIEAAVNEFTDNFEFTVLGSEIEFFYVPMHEDLTFEGFDSFMLAWVWAYDDVSFFSVLPSVNYSL